MLPCFLISKIVNTDTLDWEAYAARILKQLRAEFDVILIKEEDCPF